MSFLTSFRSQPEVDELHDPFENESLLHIEAISRRTLMVQEEASRWAFYNFLAAMAGLCLLALVYFKQSR